MKANIPFPKHRKSRNTIFRFSHSNKPNFRKLISQCKDNGKCPVAEVVDYGGPGSGDFGHKGRPGQVGGSAGGGGGGSARGPEFDPSGSPDSPDFVGPPDPNRRSGGGSATRARSAARVAPVPRGSSGDGDDFTPDELGIVPEDPSGSPDSPDFIGPPVPGPRSISSSRTTSEILSSIGETIAKGNAQSEALAKDLSSIEGSDTETAGEVEAVIQDFPDLPPNILDTLKAILDAGIATAPVFADSVKEFLSDIFTSDGDAVDIDTAERGIDKFNNSVIGVSRDEILSSIRQDFRRVATGDILQSVAEEVFNGNVKPDKESVRKAIEAIQAANRGDGPGGTGGPDNFGGKRDPKENATKQFSRLRRGVKEALIKTDALALTGKIEKFLAFEIMNGDLKTDDASIKKAFDDLISAREGLAADKAQAKEDEKLAKAQAKAEKKVEKEAKKAEAAEFKRVNKVVRRRFISSPSGSVPDDAGEPVEPPPTIPDVIDDLNNDEILDEDIVLALSQSLGASDAIEKDVKALEDAGIVSTSGDGIVSITNNGSIPPVKIDPQKISACGQRSKLERAGKDSDLQQIIDNGIERGSITADSNISEVLNGLQDTCPLDNKTDFVRFLLKKSDNREEDVEMLISDGIADRDESGNAFITEDTDVTDDVEKNSEEDIYMLAESCSITANSGCPLLLSVFAENGNKDIGWTEVFEFDDSGVLDILVKNFSKLKEQLSPPLKLGHDEEQRLVQNSGFPSAGWITGLKRKGTTNKLLAFFSSVPGPIVKLIESGAYKRISAEIYNNYIDPDTNEEFGPAMRAVSILGADVPRIKTLKDLAIIYHSDGLPYKTFQTEDIGMIDEFVEDGNVDEIMSMMDRLREAITALAGLGRDKVEGAVNEIDGAVESLQEKFGKTANSFQALCEKQNKEIKKLKKIDKSGANADTLKLSETIDSQANLITQLSESVKTIGTELKSATDHMLDAKKKSIHASLSKNFSPALVEKAMPLINFSEGEDKIVDLLKTMQELQENSALFLEDPVDIEQEEFVTSMGSGNSQDKLHNQVTALAEKDGIDYTEAFDRVLALKNATK